MSKPKLLKLYRIKKGFLFNRDLPTEGIWETIGVKDVGSKDCSYRMRCLFPMHPKRKHLQELKVWKQFIEEFMEEVEIVPVNR